VNVAFSNCRIHRLNIEKNTGEEYELYDPTKINRFLTLIGGTIQSSDGTTGGGGESVAEIIQSDTELQIVRKILMIFMRSTQISEHILTLRLGVYANRFFSEIESDLLGVGVLDQIKHTGSGSTHRYKLGKQVAIIENALRSSDGKYSVFLDAIRTETGVDRQT
jgi:hypothetical protein